VAARFHVTKIPFSLALLDHVVLRVPDMAKALSFYSGVLGAYEERRLDAIGLVQLRAGQSIIDLVDVTSEWMKAHGARPFTPEARNVDHVCLRVDPFDEERIEKHLASHGIEITERGQRYGAQGTGPSVYIREPFGTVIELKGPATPVETDAPMLKTAHLVLRPLKVSDAPDLLPVFSDPETMRYWAHPAIRTLADMREIIARNLPPQNRPHGAFAITRDGRTPIGALNFYAERDAMSGLGYILGKEHWGRGYVVEAVAAAVDHGFTMLSLHRIWLEIDPRNLGSVRVAEKAGFVYEGRFRKSFLLAGEYCDSVFYAMLREDWLKRARASDKP
jgi:glyoxylase I family protein